MRDRQVRLRTDTYEFVQDSAFTLSGLVRKAIDEVMNGNREFPNETSRDTEGVELTRTSATVTDEHDDYLASHDVVFSVFVHHLIEERMDHERLLQKVEETNDV